MTISRKYKKSGCIVILQLGKKLGAITVMRHRIVTLTKRQGKRLWDSMNYVQIVFEDAQVILKIVCIRNID